MEKLEIKINQTISQTQNNYEILLVKKPIKIYKGEII